VWLWHRYSYYDQIVSLRMLPLQRMVLWTQRLRAEIFRTSGGDSRIVFAGAWSTEACLLAGTCGGVLYHSQSEWILLHLMVCPVEMAALAAVNASVSKCALLPVLQRPST
jgi:hypothetical protein